MDDKGLSQEKNDRKVPDELRPKYESSPITVMFAIAIPLSYLFPTPKSADWWFDFFLIVASALSWWILLSDIHKWMKKRVESKE